MPTIYAVMAVSDTVAGPEFIMTKAALPQDAANAVAHDLARQGRSHMQLVAIFTREDLAKIDAQMAGMEANEGIRPSYVSPPAR